MSLHLKKLGVKIGIRILHGLIALKKGLTFLLFILVVPLQLIGRFLWTIAGRFLVLSCVRLTHAVRQRKTIASHPLAVLFLALLATTLLYQIVRPSTTRSNTADANDVIEYATTIDAIDTDILPLQAISATPAIPGEEEGQLPAIAVGNALVAPTINTTRLENRLRETAEEYIITEGDTLSDIAERFGISVETILWENKLSLRSILRPGMTLTILPVSGISHIIARGETIGSIARRYKAEERIIFEFNELALGTALTVGQKLIIPEAEPPPVPVTRPSRPSPRPLSPIARPEPVSGIRMIVPTVYKRISQWFTWRHSGIDMATNYGTPIAAARDGVVVQSGWGTGYGLYVLVDHGDGLMTRYAHNSKNLVARGDRVKRGQKIALIGSTGRSSGPHLHFETIVNGRFVNPLRYITL